MDNSTLNLTNGYATTPSASWIDIGTHSAAGPLRLYGVSPPMNAPAPAGYCQDYPRFPSPVENGGQTQAITSANNGQWLDSDYGTSLTFSAPTSGVLITDIFDFPAGFSGGFHVFAGGMDLGTYQPGDHVIFPNGGVKGFTVTGINTDGATANLAFKLGFSASSSDALVTIPFTGFFPSQQSSVDTTIIFTGTAQTTAVQNVASSFQLNSLRFDGSLAAFALSGSGLDFHASTAGMQPTIVQSSPNPVTIANDMTFATAYLTCGGSGAMTVSGNVSGIQLSKIGPGTLTTTGFVNLSYLAATKERSSSPAAPCWTTTPLSGPTAPALARRCWTARAQFGRMW
jgi:hypothetical protein